MHEERRALHDLAVAEAFELLGIAYLTRQVQALTRTIEMNQENIMATVADLNTKLDELLKDVSRVLALVSNAPLPAATQAEVDALAARIDSLDAGVEAVSPEPVPPVAPTP